MYQTNTAAATMASGSGHLQSTMSSFKIQLGFIVLFLRGKVAGHHFQLAHNDSPFRVLSLDIIFCDSTRSYQKKEWMIFFHQLQALSVASKSQVSDQKVDKSKIPSRTMTNANVLVFSDI